jgi:hypothetical protein
MVRRIKSEVRREVQTVSTNTSWRSGILTSLRATYSRLAGGGASSIFTGWDLNVPQKGAAHLLFTAEAADFRDGFDAILSLLKPAPCRLDTNGLYSFRRRPPAFGSIGSCKIPGLICTRSAKALTLRSLLSCSETQRSSSLNLPDSDCACAASEQRRVHPVRRRPSSVEDARRSQKEATNTHPRRSHRLRPRLLFLCRGRDRRRDFRPDHRRRQGRIRRPRLRAAR